MSDFSCPLTILVLHGGFIVLTINCFHCVFYPIHSAYFDCSLCFSFSIFSHHRNWRNFKGVEYCNSGSWIWRQPRKRCGIHFCIGLQIKEKIVRSVMEKTTVDRVKENEENLVKMFEELRNCFTNYRVSRVWT